jgi:hypothetical protein
MLPTLTMLDLAGPWLQETVGLPLPTLSSKRRFVDFSLNSHPFLSAPWFEGYPLKSTQTFLGDTLIFLRCRHTLIFEGYSLDFFSDLQVWNPDFFQAATLKRNRQDNFTKHPRNIREQNKRENNRRREIHKKKFLLPNDLLIHNKTKRLFMYLKVFEFVKAKKRLVSQNVGIWVWFSPLLYIKINVKLRFSSY